MSFLNVPVSIFPTHSRTIADIPIRVVLNETTNDSLTITKQPVQQGASITDHAYKEPTTLGMTVYFDQNIGESLSDIYSNLLKLQAGREPITVSTPKRTYTNMLIASIGLTTDQKTENILAILIHFQEIIIVKVSTAQIQRSKQKNPGATAATEKAGKKNVSAAKNFVDGVKGLFKQ